MKTKEKTKKDASEISDISKIAKFYGFRYMNAPTLIKQDFDVVKKFDPDLNPEEKAALLRIYFEEKKTMPYQMSGVFCEKPFPGSKDHSSVKKSGILNNYLISVGSPKYVSECLSIQAGISILEEVGYKNLEVHLNSVGDKDSINTFQKNLAGFVRKNINSFPSDLKQVVKKDLFGIIKENKEEWDKFKKECPKPIDFLSEQSRVHFKQVLEFLEVMDIPYTINTSLLGDLEIGSETVFSIKSEGETLAHGFRFNRLSKKIGYKKEVPCTMLGIHAKIIKKPKKIRISDKNTKFCLIQFGTEARLQSFIILRELYNSRVNVLHTLEKDRLDDQIHIAEKSGAKYIILIGQKEALNGTVVFRNISTRAQEIVPVAGMSEKVKELE